MKKKAVALVSGGADSSTLLALVTQNNYEIYAISFNYEQRHKVELEMIRSFIKDYNVINHKIINIDLNIFGGSSLTDMSIEVPKYKNINEIENNSPITYVPARNTIFLSYALALAEVTESEEIFLGVHMTDYAGYPDCRPEYIESFQKLANLAIAKKNKIKISAPFLNYSKSQIIATGLKLGVNYAKTISCYQPTTDLKSCGACSACLIRLNAFADNNQQDPAIYIKNF